MGNKAGAGADLCPLTFASGRGGWNKGVGHSATGVSSQNGTLIAYVHQVASSVPGDEAPLPDASRMRFSDFFKVRR